MPKFLCTFILTTSGYLHTKRILTTMSKRNNFHRGRKLKPEAKIGSRLESALTKIIKKVNVETLAEPNKSKSDKKNYKTIRLENGLTALLISDPSRQFIDTENNSSEEETSESDESTGQKSDDDKSVQSASSDQYGTKRRDEFDEEKLAACALAVRVGSYSDPPDIQGLAHFVEHMVFMGSEKYPKENEFDSFIKKKGGTDNASTDCEVTTFYFEIQEKHLPQAMDIFSQFFVSPLMKKEAMQRERESIESEFAIAAPSDSNRKDQLLSSLFPDGHPAKTFTWGNIRSLRDEIQDDEKLHKAAHEFRARHYSAHRMTVAIQARMDLAELERYVSDKFGQIPTNKLPPDDFTDFQFKPEFVSPKFKDIYYMKPLSDVNEVHLTWCMRSLFSEYESKPHQYVSQLLGHEGRGSLLSYLKKKVWALGIYTGNPGSGMDYASMYSLFSAQVILTKDGLDHVEEVIEAIFSYIEMLKRIGPSERTFEEIKRIEETSFLYSQEIKPMGYVETLAENMHLFPPKHYITGEKLFYKYDPKGITELLDSMTADMVNVFIVSNKHAQPIHYDAKEKWFGTDYKRIEKPKDWLNKWLNVEPYEEFNLPEKNVYIADNFDLVPPAAPYLEEAERLGVDLINSSVKDIHKKVSESEKITKVLLQDDLMATVNNFRLDQPNLLRRNRHMELWYKPDFKFRFPTAIIYFYFITPLILRSARDACLIDLWTDVLQQGLKEEVYPAIMADLSHTIHVSDKGITLKVSGYSQKLHLVVELVVREMARGGSLTPQLFEAVRQVRAQHYHNLLLKPHKLANDVRMSVLLSPYISACDKLAVIQNITYTELKDYTAILLGKLYMQVLAQGNLPWYETIRISEKVLDHIKWDALSENEMPEIKVHELPLGERRVRVRNLNPASTNSIVTAYYQGEPASTSTTAALELLMMLMEEPAFDALRTKEQLGYSVYSMMRYTFGVLGCSIFVNTQADKFTVSHVEQRIEAFLKKFARDTRRGGERALAPARRGLEQLKHTIDYDLTAEVERNWREIVGQEYQFHRLFEEAVAIQQVKLSDVKNYMEDHFKSGNKNKFRKLVIQIVGNKPQEENAITEDIEHRNLSLNFLNASDSDGDSNEDNDAFIMDIEQFKKSLPIITVPKVELSHC